MAELPGFLSPATWIIKVMAWSQKPFTEFPGRRVSRQEGEWHWSFCRGVTPVDRGSGNIDYPGCHLDHSLGQDKPGAVGQWGPQGGFVLEEKLQPAPPVCVFPSETTARAEGGWQPCGDPTACPQAAARKELLWVSLSYQIKGKKKPQTPTRLHINQGNKTACGHDQIIRSKSI